MAGEADLDVFLRKYRTDGSELWTRRFGTPGYDLARSVAADGAAVFVAGTIGSTLPFDDSGDDGHAPADVADDIIDVRDLASVARRLPVGTRCQ